jgi:hypothetical protein
MTTTETKNEGAMRELASLLVELERWRRRQYASKATKSRAAPRTRSVSWLFVRERSGACVRIRFERGLPVELRTSASDRVQAISAANRALDVELIAKSDWKRDARSLEWVLEVAAPAPQ